MRTTLDIDQEVLNTVKEMARRQRRSAGAVLSDLARRGLTQGKAPSDQAVDESFLGFAPLPVGDRIVGDDTVDEIRDELGV
ncbi:MAG: antitoxin [Gammaproteobacteria bacterium]